MDIALLGFACGYGGRIDGAQSGPQAFRQLQIASRLEKLGHSVRDWGDTAADTASLAADFSPREKATNNFEYVYRHCAQLSMRVREAVTSNHFPLILGGDHSVSLGGFAAMSNLAEDEKPLGLLWVDTHPDINTPETSASKNLHGMTVSFLLGNVSGAFSKLGPPKPLRPEHIVYVGLRDVDPAERKFIRELGIRAYSMKEIDIHGVAKVMDQALSAVCRDTSGFVMSFDLDVCDPCLVPGTGTPIRGGLTFREAHLVMELAADSQQMKGLEVVELNPALDSNCETAELAVNLVESALGKSIL